MLLADELRKRHRVVMHVDEPDLFVEEAIKFVRWNVGFVAGEWVVPRGSENKGASNSYFACLVDDLFALNGPPP